MSNDSEDPPDDLATDLQPTVASASDAPPDGPLDDRSGATSPDGPTPAPAAPSPATVNVADRADAPTPAATQAHLTGEPGTLPLTWCRKCAANVKPEKKGSCPRCGSFLKLNFVARRHPVNKLRRVQLLDQFTIDYRPNTQRLLSMCDQFADITERLETTKAGTPEHQRLVQSSQLLGAQLEESRAARSTHNDDDRQHRTPDELIARLDVLRKQAEYLRDDKVSYTPPTTPPTTSPIVAPAPAEPEWTCPVCNTQPCTAPKLHGTPIPKAERACMFCHSSSPAGCAELKATRLDVWHVLHGADPEEVQRRRQEEADDDADTQQFLATGMISSRMREKAEARKPKLTDEQKQQAAKRRELGWDEGVLNETTGYRRRE